MSLISAGDLERFAGKHESEAALHELLNRLVCATSSSIEVFRFPSGKSIYQPGWDGYVEAESLQECYLPSGPSVWEVSTREDYFYKAKEDFDKRTADAGAGLPYGFKANATTYVAVTLRKWAETTGNGRGRQDFLKYAKGKGVWKDVKVIDAEDLAGWIAGKLAIESWLAGMLDIPGKFPVHAEKAWASWVDQCRYEITPGMVLVDRTEAADDVRAALAGVEGICIVKGDSVEEAQAFVIASFLSLPNGDIRKDSFLARAFVIKDESFAEYLSSTRNDAVLILRDKAADLAGHLKKSGYLVYIPVGNRVKGRETSIELKRQSRTSFVKGLESTGLRSREADRIARNCHSNLTVMIRNFASATVKEPDWAAPGNIDNLIPAILAGQWDEALDNDGNAVYGDRAIVGQLANRPYEEYRTTLHHYLLFDDAPLRVAGSIVVLTAPTDSFNLGQRSTTPDTVHRFGGCLKMVFGEEDPFANMNAEERLSAQFKGVRPRYSEWLREGLSETLLLISAIGDDAVWGDRFNENIMFELLSSHPEPAFITDLGSQLPALMEAAPKPFLDTLDRLVQGNPSELGTVFFKDTPDESYPWGDHSPHTYLLWGLETLAWSPDYFPLASLIIAGLASIDPGGRLANRPINTLREIFLPWKPGTNAPFEDRKQVFNRICTSYPDIGWKLCLSSLPTGPDVSFPTSEPKRHDYGRPEKEEVTRGLVYTQYCFFLERAVELAGVDPDRWEVVLRALRNYDSEKQNSVIARLREVISDISDESGRSGFWKMIRGFVHNQISFKEAEWSLKGEALEELQALQEEIAPKDPSILYESLFSEIWPDLGIPRKHSDEYEAEIAKRRFEALSEINRVSGYEGIVDFARGIKYPGLLATPWVDLAASREEIIDIILLLTKDHVFFQQLISSISIAALNKFGADWVDSIRELPGEDGFPQEIAIYCAFWWPDDSSTFSFISSLGEDAERIYWETRPAGIRTKDPDTFNYILERLINVGRVLDAVDLVATFNKELPIETPLLLRLICLIPAALNERGTEPIDSMTAYSIRELFDLARQRDDADRNKIAEAEYPLLGILIEPWGKTNLVLHEFLSASPEFFVSVICAIYKPASAEKDIAVDEDRLLRARLARRLLDSWYSVPGDDGQGNIDESSLSSWVESARELSVSEDRVVITDQQIGRILAHAPNDIDDGVWPCRPVRNVIESVKSEDVVTGIVVELHNKRGAFTKEMFEGGGQEKDIAEKWRDAAKAIGASWPYTGSILARLAENYERAASAADTFAEQERIRYGD